MSELRLKGEWTLEGRVDRMGRPGGQLENTAGLGTKACLVSRVWTEGR